MQETEPTPLVYIQERTRSIHDSETVAIIILFGVPWLWMSTRTDNITVVSHHYSPAVSSGTLHGRCFGSRLTPSYAAALRSETPTKIVPDDTDEGTCL